jgi:hypothetical protein
MSRSQERALAAAERGVRGTAERKFPPRPSAVSPVRRNTAHELNPEKGHTVRGRNHLRPLFFFMGIKEKTIPRAIFSSSVSPLFGR